MAVLTRFGRCLDSGDGNRMRLEKLETRLRRGGLDKVETRQKRSYEDVGKTRRRRDRNLVVEMRPKRGLDMFQTRLRRVRDAASTRSRRGLHEV